MSRFSKATLAAALAIGLAGGVTPLPNPNTIFWGGYGGSIAIIDMDARTSFAYVMNKMAPTTTGDMRGFGNGQFE